MLKVRSDCCSTIRWNLQLQDLWLRPVCGAGKGRSFHLDCAESNPNWEDNARLVTNDDCMPSSCLPNIYINIYIASPAIPSIFLFLDVSCLCAEEDALRFQRTGSQSLIECPDWCPHVCWLPAICQWTIGHVSRKKRETTSNCQVQITYPLVT